MTMIDQNTGNTIVAMAGFALATSASPGPVNIVSAMSGAKFGASRTIPYVFGGTLGFVSILAIPGAGLSPLITKFPLIERVLAILGSIYMLYLAYKLARASMDSLGKLEDQMPPNLMSGVIAQYTNPKAWIVAISAISIYVSTNPDYKSALTLFCTIFFLICFPSLFAWSIIGASASKRLGSIKIFNTAMALLLVASVAAFIIEFFN